MQAGEKLPGSLSPQILFYVSLSAHMKKPFQHTREQLRRFYNYYFHAITSYLPKASGDNIICSKKSTRHNHYADKTPTCSNLSVRFIFA